MAKKRGFPKPEKIEKYKYFQHKMCYRNVNITCIVVWSLNAINGSVGVVYYDCIPYATTRPGQQRNGKSYFTVSGRLTNFCHNTVKIPFSIIISIFL